MNSEKNQLAKREKGQFFTTTNPFSGVAFTAWMRNANAESKTSEIIEPFAGSNNIVKMVRDVGILNSWQSFDIDPPQKNAANDVPVQKLDTISNFPKNYKIAITNPPYLAKNSPAAKKSYAGGEYDDLYKKCIHVMLENVDYVAAIIPETFIRQGCFRDRLWAVVSLTCKMFDDTEHPVCLALFVPRSEKTDEDFQVWKNDVLLGRISELQQFLDVPTINKKWKFNVPDGKIGIKCADGKKQASIKFVPGIEIPSDEIKHSSRHNTRISIEGFTDEEISLVIQKANIILNLRRTKTSDVFMTAHRGLRDDGQYRRRLDFAQAREILNLAAQDLEKNTPTSADPLELLNDGTKNEN